MKTTKKKLTKAQNGKNVLRAGRVKKAVAESQAGINRTGWKGFKNQAKIDNIDDQPEMHPGTLDKNVLKTTGKKSPIYYDPKKSSYKQGGTVKKLTKAQNGGIMGFGSLGKTKNTLSQKDMDKMRKEGAAQAKRNKEANKKFNADIKSGKIKLAGVSKNKK